MAGREEINNIGEMLKVVQVMIDISADRLNGLRTHCATSVDLTRQEIRTLEGKLLKMFARQLVMKSELRGEAAIYRNTPSVRQWLQVVGLQKDSVEGICEKVDSLEALQEKSDHELKTILNERKAKQDEFRRLNHALFNLRRYTDILQRGDNNSEEPSDLALYWDSWDRQHRHKPVGSLSPHVSRNRTDQPPQPISISNPPSVSDDGLSYNNNNEYNSSDGSISSITSFVQSPPTTPPVGPKTKVCTEKHKQSSTPPPHKKHFTGASAVTTGLLPGVFPLTKSKSHESQLSARAPENGDAANLLLMPTKSPTKRPRLPAEPGAAANDALGLSSSTIPLSPVPGTPLPLPLNPTITCSNAASPVSSKEITSPQTNSPTPTSPAVCTSPNSTPVHTKTSSPMSPGPLTPRHTPSPNTPNACVTSPLTVSPLPSSPASLSPIPGSPIALSPISPRKVNHKCITGGVTSPHTPRSKFIDSSPVTPHSTNSSSSPVFISPIKSPLTPGIDSEDSNSSQANLQVPKSPHKITVPVTTSASTVSRSMRHCIEHHFTKMYKVITTCDYCHRQMLFATGLKCRECKYVCHRECKDKVPPACGLPSEFVNVFKWTMSPGGKDFAPPSQSPNPGPTPVPSPIHHHNNFLGSLRKKERERKRSHPQPSINVAPFLGHDSSSNTSSCNSSTPSSPALLSIHTPASVNKLHFHFPDVDRGITIETHPLEELAETQASNDSDKTISACGSGSGGSASTDSERTPVRFDSQESQVSDGEVINERENQRWPRQNSQLSMREWDIPFEELNIGERIGVGRFGTVYRGNWHGDVAIKVLNMDYLDDDKALEAFKSEVGTFRKTRHENLVLFMGACMNPPRLAIVTSLSKGMTLYTHIHLRKDKFNMNKTTIVAQQISQGMGYLHARGIVHKDLKSKNIFLENGKVVITDFGLFSVTKLCYGNGKGDSLNIPPGWLCYLAPEIVRSLRANQSHRHYELPFSKASDIYAFGTVWYELLCGEWPFKGQAPESVIWQVGKGVKQPLANLQASRDVKDILMLCWAFRPHDRKDFGELLNLLEKLPKKRLARSPSHPVHLSRSAESVF